MNIQSIKNVNNTLNAPIFKGAQQNYTNTSNSSFGANNDSISLLTGFAGVIQRTIELLFPQIVSRAESIQVRLDEFKRLNVLA